MSSTDGPLVALITGATSGIGLVTRRLARRGLRVFICQPDPPYGRGLRPLARPPYASRFAGSKLTV